MNNKAAGSMVMGVLALGLIVSAAFLPWFHWFFQGESHTGDAHTSVWGPPAYFPEASYVSVDVPPDGIRAVNWGAGVYLALFLLGIALWIALLRLLGRGIERRIVPLVLGAGSVTVSVGLVVLLGLAELIAQRVGWYAAARTSGTVVAQIVGLRAAGPLALILGVAAEAALLIREKRRQRK